MLGSLTHGRCSLSLYWKIISRRAGKRHSVNVGQIAAVVHGIYAEIYATTGTAWASSMRPASSKREQDRLGSTSALRGDRRDR